MIKFYKTIFILICLLMISATSFSQISNDMVKYWYYRNRLNKYFVIPGEQHGESQIICVRNVIPSEWSYSHVDNVDYGQHGKYTGLYLGVLATEYYLLNKNGQYGDANKTRQELLYALNAIKVWWDEDAEHYWPLKNYCNPEEPTIYLNNFNGFLTRGNVPCDFFNVEQTENLIS